MKTVSEIQKEQENYGKELNGELINNKKEEVKQKRKRISPQLSCTVTKKDLDWIKDMALFYSHKKRRLCTVSGAIRIIIKYCREMEHELQDR